MTSLNDDKRPSQVLDHLFIGSRAHAKNRGLLKELGINRILNVTPPKTMDSTNGVPNFFEKDRSMTYKRVAVFDNRGEDLLQHFDSCIAFIEQGSFYGKVLVHCNKGVSRSSTVVAAYLMRNRGLTKDEALTYLRSRRSIVCPHEGFMAQLEAFDAKLKIDREAAIAEGRPKKYPQDLLGTTPAPSRGALQGPSRGPSVAAPGANKSSRGTTSPPRGPARGPAIGPSPPRSSTSSGTKKRDAVAMIGPPRGPSPPPPLPDAASRDSAKKARTVDGGETRSCGDGCDDVEDSSSKKTNGCTSRTKAEGSSIGPAQRPEIVGGSKREGGNEGLEGQSKKSVVEEVIGPAVGRPTSVVGGGVDARDAKEAVSVENGRDCAGDVLGEAKDGLKSRPGEDSLATVPAKAPESAGGSVGKSQGAEVGVQLKDAMIPSGVGGGGREGVDARNASGNESVANGGECGMVAGKRGDVGDEDVGASPTEMQRKEDDRCIQPGLEL